MYGAIHAYHLLFEMLYAALVSHVCMHTALSWSYKDDNDDDDDDDDYDDDDGDDGDDNGENNDDDAQK